MTTLAEFEKNFNGHAMPELLRDLLEFQGTVGDMSYSQAIFLAQDDKSGLAHGWSDDPTFLRDLIPFAIATGSGSFYALWNNGTDENLSEWPVVLFGDEGGEWIVARNLRELIQISTCDVEPMLYEEVSFYKDEEHENSVAINRYQDWLMSRFKIEPIEDPLPIVQSAQDQLQASFDAWKKPYLVHWDNE